MYIHLAQLNFQAHKLYTFCEYWIERKGKRKKWEYKRGLLLTDCDLTPSPNLGSRGQGSYSESGDLGYQISRLICAAGYPSTRHEVMEVY